MKKKVFLFKSIEDELLKKIVPQINNLLFYNSDNTIIDYYKENNNIVLKDEKGIWVPSKKLRIEGILSIENPSVCFNDDKYKIAYEGSTIGVAMKIFKNKIVHETIHLGTFNNEDKNVNLRFSKVFEDNELFHSVSVSFYLYIYEPVDDNTNSCIANDKGMILGTLCEEIIIIDGMSSELHISLVAKSSNDPLWNLSFEYEDISTDLLHDCYNLIINTENKDYKYLNSLDKENFNRALFNEIIVESLLIVINTVYKKDGIDISDEYDEGSIAQFIDYLKNTILCNEVNLEDLNSVSQKLRGVYLSKTNNV